MGKKLQFDFNDDMDDVDYPSPYRIQIKRKRSHKLEENLELNRKRVRVKRKYADLVEF